MIKINGVEALAQPRQTRAEVRFDGTGKIFSPFPIATLKDSALPSLIPGIFWRGELKRKRSQIRKQGYVTYSIKILKD